MKRLLALLLFPLAVLRADKLTDYSAASSLLTTDIFYVVTDPGGTPATHKATFSTLIDLLDGATMTLTNKSIDLGTNTVTATSAQMRSAISDETGSGVAVFATSPTLVTPTLGVATATSINGLTITSSTGTLTIANGKTASFSNTLAFTGTDSASVAFGAGGTVIYAANHLGALSSTTSSQFAGVISDETGTGSVVLATSPTLVTPALGAATATSVAATGAVTSSGTAGVGYATGAGGTVTQATSKSTGVTLNKITGAITMNNASLNDATNVSFTVTNSTVAATDVVVVNHSSGGTAGAYQVHANSIGSGAFAITVRNVSGGALGEAIVLSYAVIKSVQN